MLMRSLLLVFLLAVVPRARPGVLAQFDFNFGTVDVELYEQDKPETVRNFLAYVNTGLWSPTIMHRWVQNFVIQGGSYYLSSTGVVSIPPFPAVTNEYSVGRPFSNVFGTIAMARVSGQTNSATSSWFFNVRDNQQLDDVDGGFTVFGGTLRGTNVLDRFRYPEGTTNLFFLRDAQDRPTEVPLYVTNSVASYVVANVRILTANIARVAGGNQITWGSVAGLTNVVEFTRTLPPAWETAASIIGTGAPLSITNDPGADSLRHYRVRIVYPN
jgi:cyclophilin family peptidyl-prolyl cis-trans isomerase